MRATAFRTAAIVFSVLTAISVLHGQGQQPAPAPMTAMVPRLVRFSGRFVPANGLPPAPVESATLAIFREQQGGRRFGRRRRTSKLIRPATIRFLWGLRRTKGYRSISLLQKSHAGSAFNLTVPEKLSSRECGWLAFHTL